MIKKQTKQNLSRKISVGLICTMIFSESVVGLTYGATDYELSNEAFVKEYVPEINTEGVIPGYAEYLKSGMEMYSNESSENIIYSDYIEAAINDEGRFTIGNRIGRDDTTNDDNQILLYGHPDARTSYTTIFIDGNAYIFAADSEISYPDSKTAVAKQIISGVEITQTLRIVSNVDNGNEDTVNISYTAKNIDGNYHTAGFRIMLDTKLGSNDGAPFKVPGIGNVTTELELKGNDIPKYWQAYDYLEDASVFAVGTLYQDISERPDKIQFASWQGVTNVPGNYEVTSGRPVINDSAVAVYWDEVSLGVGKTKNVSTFYGVGYSEINSSMTQNIVVPNDYFGILVIDESGKAVPETTVTLGGKQIPTDAQGLALFKVASNPGTHQVDINKSGYLSRCLMVDVAGGLTRTITLDSDLTNPIIGVSASYDGEKKDLLSEYFSFNEYKENSNRDTVNDIKSELIIDVKTHEELSNASYQIWSGYSKVIESNDPLIKIDVYERVADSTSGYRYPALKDFTAGENVELRIYQNGNRIAQKMLGIRVYSPGFYMDGNSKTEVELKSGFSVKVPDDVPVIGNSTLNIGENEYELPLYVVAEGNKVKIGLNFKPWKETTEGEYDDFDTGYFYRAIEKAKKGDYKQLKEVCEAGDLHYGDGFTKGKISICGYGEGEYKGDGLCNFAMNVHIMLDIEGRAIYHTLVVMVPVYAKLEGSAKLGAEGSLGANVVFAPSFRVDDITWDIDIKPEIGVKPSVGVGIDSILSAGVGGNLALKALYKTRNSYAKADLNGSIFLEAYVSPLIHWEKKFVDETWNLWDGYISDRAYGESIDTDNLYGNYFDLNQYELISLSEMNVYSSAGGFNDTIINARIPRGNTINLVKNNQNDLFAFYFGDGKGSLDDSGVMLTKIMMDSDGDEVLSDSVRITEAISDGTKSASYNMMATPSNAVATPSNIIATSSNAKSFVSDVVSDAASTADMYYDLYQDGDMVYVVVSKLRGSLDDISDVSEILKATEIYTIEINIKTNEISHMTRITDNNAIDINPQIYRDDNGVHIAWLSVEAKDGDIFSETAEYVIQLYDEKTHKTRSINVGNRRVFDLAVGKLNNKVVAVYSVDVDGDNTTANDLELFTYDGTTEVQMTHNDVKDYAPQFYDNHTKLMWYQDGAIYGTTKINEGTQIIGADIAVASNFKVIEGNNKFFVAWEDIDPKDNKTAIYMVQKNNDRWGERFIVYKDEDYIVSPVDGYVDKNGLTLLHINTDNIFEDDTAGSGLVLSRDIVATNLSIESVTYDLDDVEIENELPLEIMVKNNGNSVIKEINIGIDEEIEPVSVNLQPGEKKLIKIKNFTVPAMEEVTTFTIYAEVSKISNSDTEESIWELDDEDNFYTFELGYTDLMVDTGIEIINEEDYVVVNIKNISYMPSDANLKLLADTDDGVVLADLDVGEIPANSTRTIKYRIQDINAGSDLTSIIAAVTPMGEEIVTENNRSSVYVGSSTVRYRLNITAGTGGSVNQVSGNYQEGREIELKASPFEGYRFIEWVCSEEDVIEDKNSEITTLKMPEKDIDVTAMFEPIDSTIMWTLTIENGEGGTVNGSTSGTYVEGAEIRLLAVAKEDYQFFKWNCNVDGIIQEDGEAEIAFKMPNCDLTIKAEFEKISGKKAVESITISPAELTMNVKEEKMLSAVVFPEDATDKSITWYSSNKDIVTVDNTGKVTAIAKGNAEIYCVSLEENVESNHCLINVISDSGNNGGSSGSGKSRNTDKSKSDDGSTTLPSYVVRGTWSQADDGSWSFVDLNGIRYINTWAAIENPYADVTKGQKRFDWFRFDESGKMLTGWFYDSLDGYWYYLNPISDNTLGRMVTGWFVIDGNYYYFNINSDGHQGRLYVNETTPDGYQVDSKGKWIK